MTHILALCLKTEQPNSGIVPLSLLATFPQLYVGVQPTISEETLQHSDQQDDDGSFQRLCLHCGSGPFRVSDLSVVHSTKVFPKALKLWRQYQSELFKETSGDRPEDLPSAIPESSFSSIPTFGNSGDTTRTATTDGGIGKSKVRVRSVYRP